ncbi:Penicillin-binding protein 1A/1B [uncultured Clostridium sp.]|nr:Penicillin-binding protein 1A/1B [uncultured Clostridium sp.]
MYKHVIDKRRIIFILIIYVSVLMLLSVRLYYLQVQPSTQVQGELQNHQIETLSELNYRILDTNGKDLLNYKKKYVLVIDSRPFQLNNYEETLEDLLALNFIMKSEDPSFNYSDIIALNGKTYYDEITEETYNKIKKLNNIKGIYLYVYDMVNTSEGWRIENFIANIREDNVAEGSFQHQILNIVGENEYPSISFNLDQKANYTESVLNYGENNKNLKLTINKEWEEKIRDILLDDSYSFLENIGVVLLESETGKIRAMVQKDESKANVNLGIGTIGYEPGSIFKVLTEAIGLDLGKISLSSVFTCEGKICTKLGEPYAHGALTVDEALQVSCNDIFAKVGELSGYENMIEYTEKLGLYQKILGLAGENKEEAAGVKATYEDGISNFSIGQCVTVTPLQIAGAINAVVNNGVYIKPTIIDSIIDNDDNEVEHIEVEGKRVFSETTAKIVQDSMTNVIWKGTGYEAKVEGIAQGGKTGTSTGEGGKTNHGWFAGYFEMDGKKYTLLVVAPNIGDNHPDGRELGGGNTGAPIFRQIINSLISNN